MKTATEEAMADLHAELARVLKEQLMSEAPCAAMVNVARQFLRDNNIQCDTDMPGATIESIAERFKETGADVELVDLDALPEFKERH